MELPEILSQRADFSRRRLVALQEAVSGAAKDVNLPGLTIFTAGSFARLEGSEHSDIDLFFIYKDTSEVLNRRTNELRLFGRLIEVVEELGYPALSNDAQFLEAHDSKSILRHLGSPHDDFKNYFTLRMLLLLESKSVYGAADYDGVIRDIIESYFRDYPKHDSEFSPWFLLNDIMRFWKTLLLNYENKRNLPEEAGSSADQRVKNFKLKFSRMTTCFATIAAIGSSREPLNADALISMISQTPQERLHAVLSNLPQLHDDIGMILSEYSWFLGRTGLPKKELHAQFDTPEDRRLMFNRANNYGELMYKLIARIDDLRPTGTTSLVRILVV